MIKHLNLLPPNRRSHLRREAVWGAIIKISRTLALGVSLVTVAAIVAWLIIWILSALATQSTQQKLTQEIQVYNDLRRVIDDKNEVLSVLAQRGSDRIVWAEKIAQVLGQMPADSVVHNIDASRDSRSLTLTGQAPLRSSLVIFEENVSDLPWLAEIDAPRDNLLSPVNPLFIFTFKVKDDGQRE